MELTGMASTLLAMLIAGFSLGFTLGFILLQNLRGASEVGITIRFYKTKERD